MRRWTWSGCVLSTLVSLMIYVSGTVPTLEELSSALFDSVSFNVSHVTLDSDTGRLYVGAVNRLYELSPALERLHEVVTGPYPDNPMCPPPPEPCRCTVISCRGGTDRFPIDGVTKTLLIDYNARQLIHCTNLFQVNNLSSLSLRLFIQRFPLPPLGHVWVSRNGNISRTLCATVLCTTVHCNGVQASGTSSSYR